MKPKPISKRPAKRPAIAGQPAKGARRTGGPFPIVGIGASAGGLEALEQFLRHVPANSGMAFVIVQHLDPTRKGTMPELLQRATSMKVTQVKDRTRVQSDCVYVIPPDKDMSLLHGSLHLLKPAAPRGLRLPIDFFLRSLAMDQREHSIGVILSGMGSDGTLGLRAIKEAAGVSLVQDPATAKFDGMPRSAVDAGLADIVAPGEELPRRIIAYLERARWARPAGPELEAGNQSALQKVIILLRAQTGHDFSLYKRNTLYRRIERRMGLHQIDKIAGYVRYLQENSQELDLLFKELLIGVTRFFRDPPMWEQLRKQTLPQLLATHSRGQPLRAWVPGCSTGEEAYSLAIVFKEAVEQAAVRGNHSLQIFATDLDREVIEKARQGLFPANIAADVSPERLFRFFKKEQGNYRVRAEIREMVVFAPQNLIMDPPFTKLDFLGCRNLLIYLTAEAQEKLIPLFHYSLNPGGILVLGSAETIGGATDLFSPITAKTRIFQRTNTPMQPRPVEFPASFHLPPSQATEVRNLPKPAATLQSLADQLVLERYAPPAVLVNSKGDILYISGRTGKYLEPAAGKANWSLFAMAREGLRYELASGFQLALRQKENVTLRGLKIRAADGEQFVDVRIQRLDESEPLKGLAIVVFNDAAPPVVVRAPVNTSKVKARSARLAALEQELHQVRAEARSTHEEMQTSQEELRSANEELQSTNEELQSTNEELTTSKEEMQSLNEELQTLNTELQVKVEELSQTSNDMKNLLDSTDIAIVFLDKKLCVRRFTTKATDIIKLIPSDVGRPVTDLVSNLNYPALEEDVREVLRTLNSKETFAAAREDRWFNVRIIPYRTLDDRIDGIVLTFSDITGAKMLEHELRHRRAGPEEPKADRSPGKPRPRTRAKTRSAKKGAGARSERSRCN